MSGAVENPGSSGDSMIFEDNNDETIQTTIDLLPDEVLSMIFQYLNFQDHLRQSCVCKRWFNVIKEEPTFMRIVEFRVDTKKLEMMVENNTTLMRIYKIVHFSYNLSENLSAVEISLLTNAETITFDAWLQSKTSSEFMAVLKHCTQLKDCKLLYYTIIASEGIIDEPRPYLKPVKLSIVSPFCQSVKCFANITHLKVLEWFHVSKDREYATKFIKDFAPIIDSMDIAEDKTVDLLERIMKIDDLHLKSINMFCYNFENLTTATQFFRQQQPYTKKFSTIVLKGNYYLTAHEKRYMPGLITEDYFDAIRLSLSNLEVLKIRIECTENIRLNDLHVLPYLRRLSVKIDFNYKPFFELDVTELISLTYLSINAQSSRKFPVKLIVKPTEKPMVALKTLKITYMVVKKPTFNNFAKCMPNLEELLLKFIRNVSIRLHHGRIDRVINEINQLVHLKILTLTGRLISDYFMSGLYLPQLRQLVLMSDNSFDHDWLYHLEKNCPKLTTMSTYRFNSTKNAIVSEIFAEKTELGKLQIRKRQDVKIHKMVTANEESDEDSFENDPISFGSNSDDDSSFDGYWGTEEEMSENEEEMSENGEEETSDED